MSATACVDEVDGDLGVFDPPGGAGVLALDADGERRDPSYELLKKAGDQAYDELVRRHSDLYWHIRAHLARYETRYGRLQLTEPRPSYAPESTTSWTGCVQRT
ncbi:hypothetical protein [Streptomyces sp. NPDC127020]|uniref:hypothetical protein n=1 Tax=Streptomyces sp. NPDC127020 TaxID=3347109 RepID=UPI003666A09E